MFGTLDERVKCLKCSLCLHRDHSTASIIACHIKHNNKFGEFVMNLLHFGVIFMLYLSYTHIVNWVNSDEHDKSIEFMTINFIFRCVPKVFHLFLLYTFLSLFLSLSLWGACTLVVLFMPTASWKVCGHKLWDVGTSSSFRNLPPNLVQFKSAIPTFCTWGCFLCCSHCLFSLPFLLIVCSTPLASFLLYSALLALAIQHNKSLLT